MKAGRNLLTRLLAFSIIALMVTGGYATAQSRPACASIATPGNASWTTTLSGNNAGGNAGTYNVILAQDASGTVSGSETPTKTSCPYGSSINDGSALGYGEFAFDLNQANSSACVPLLIDVSISSLGCAKATGTFTGGGFNGTVTMTDGTGVLPTGETTPIPYGKEVNYPAVLVFWQNIAPITYNFQGRLINELFPNGATTNCKGVSPPPLDIAGNTYPLTNGPANNGTPVNGITTGYGDGIGFRDTEEVDTIRELGDAPCTFSATQLVTIDTATGTYQYQTNGIAYTINATTITATRGGVPQTVQLLSVSAQALPAVLDALLFQSVSQQ